LADGFDLAGMTTLPAGYAERVYAGVLGKLIGVYLGRPVEGWSYDRITATFGQIDRYVEDQGGVSLVVTDDDIAGTFTFLRALPDHGNDPHITPEQIGQTWLNYIIYRRTIVWFGGLGDSTKHTAYFRLKNGIPAPASGSIALNGKTVAEQIGAQIFIDGWGMVAPGDPERAADFARRAASVSHDGEAICGAQVIAAMEAQAFVEPDLNRLLDVGVSLIPADSTIARVIGDVRDWHAAEPDWRKTRETIDATYGADKFGGNCHIVPNHALIILALLYGEDDFRQSLTIVNTAGFDTDCNSGNVGAILGIKNGLMDIDDSGYDWRGPVADRLYLPTADGGRAITDAVRETYEIVNIGRALAGEPPLAPKDGVKFHFSLPGSVQGFIARDPGLAVEHAAGRDSEGAGALAMCWQGDCGDGPLLASTATFTPPEAIDMPFYPLLASPTLYPGQEVGARIVADYANAAPVSASIAIRSYGAGDVQQTLSSPPTLLAPGSDAELAWRVPELGGAPLFEVGIAVEPPAGTSGCIYLDRLTWDGAPYVTLGIPEGGRGNMWRRAWVDAVDRFETRRNIPYRISQDYGTGLLSQGTADWIDYRVSADISIVLARRGGIAARVGGMRLWYGLLLCDDGVARLIKSRDGEKVLAEQPFALEQDWKYRLALSVQGCRIHGEIDGTLLVAAVDDDAPLLAGGVAIVVTQGTLSCGPVRVQPHPPLPSRWKSATEG
jgi:ADP-ribosylglycohydrolase